MQINREKIRNLVREELERANLFKEASTESSPEIDDAEAEEETGETEDASSSEADAAWLNSITRVPLQIGTTSPEVKRAQSLLSSALLDATTRAIDLPTDVMRKLQAIRNTGRLKSDINSPTELTRELAQIIGRGGNPDGKFGQMTKVGTMIFQTLISGSVSGVTTDGVIGPKTGAALLRGVRRGEPLGFVEQAPVVESTIKRLHKLAGIL